MRAASENGTIAARLRAELPIVLFADVDVGKKSDPRKPDLFQHFLSYESNDDGNRSEGVTEVSLLEISRPSTLLNSERWYTGFLIRSLGGFLCMCSSRFSVAGSSIFIVVSLIGRAPIKSLFVHLSQHCCALLLCFTLFGIQANFYPTFTLPFICARLGFL